MAPHVPEFRTTAHTLISSCVWLNMTLPSVFIEGTGNYLSAGLKDKWVFVLLVKNNAFHKGKNP